MHSEVALLSSWYGEFNLTFIKMNEQAGLVHNAIVSRLAALAVFNAT